MFSLLIVMRGLQQQKYDFGHLRSPLQYWSYSVGTMTGHDVWYSTQKLSLILAASSLCSSSCELCQHHPLLPSISIHPCCLASISAIFLTFQWFVLAQVEQDPMGDILWHNTSIPPDALLVFALIPPLLSSSHFPDSSLCKIRPLEGMKLKFLVKIVKSCLLLTCLKDLE